MLQSGDLANGMKAFIKKANTMKQTDADKAIDAYCKQLEASVYKAIRSLTITIPSGMIQVEGSPSAQTNINPIVLNDVIK